AARWYLVNRGPDTAIEIDVDLAAEKSVKNPVYYVQYAHARIAGILRNSTVEVRGSEPHGALQAEERDLIKRLADFPVVVAAAAVFADGFPPWDGPSGHRFHGWLVPLVTYSALLALGAALVEGARLAAAWTSRASLLVSWFFAAAAGIMGVAALINLRWGD